MKSVDQQLLEAKEAGIYLEIAVKRYDKWKGARQGNPVRLTVNKRSIVARRRKEIRNYQRYGSGEVAREMIQLLNTSLKNWERAETGKLGIVSMRPQNNAFTVIRVPAKDGGYVEISVSNSNLEFLD